MSSFFRTGLALFLIVFSTKNTLIAQVAETPRLTALRFLTAYPAQLGLSPADVADIKVTDEYRTEHNGLTHIWIQQQYKGIPVHNGLIGLHVTPGAEVLQVGHRFVPDLAAKVNTALPSLSAERALALAMTHLGIGDAPFPGLREKINGQNYTYEGGQVSRDPIPVSACYVLTENETLRLAWTLVINMPESSDVWSIRIDAQTGGVLEKFNRTIYCNAGHPHLAGAAGPGDAAFGPDCWPNERPSESDQKHTDSSAGATGAGEATGSYRVFAFPVESPNHGQRTLVVDPSDPTASPFGWHDTNGQAGAEYTHTRGNNAHAYEDVDKNDVPPVTPNAQGGAGLVFDFPFNANSEPEQNLPAAVTNLFYVANSLHDIAYRFGFDEQAGNYQVNNYNKGGKSSDPIYAEALDGEGLNNANFTPSPDGFPGRMQMFKWTLQGGKNLEVTAPAGPVQGKYLAAAASGWGATLTATPVSGEVQVYNDGKLSSDSSLACGPSIQSLTGKIALIDRGICEFGEKALNAQKAGAVGCVICNFQEGTVLMGAGAAGAQVKIPVVMIQKSTCDLLRSLAGKGLEVSLAQESVSGPKNLDGSFDNGVVIHEYTHGISNRLTGGPSRADCLPTGDNSEQMGEGWSDFFSLALLTQPGSQPAQNRGLGTYIFREPVNGGGLRKYPFSTNMSVNPLTYASVAESGEEHSVGEVWTAMLWDLYWAFVEKYGLDPTLKDPNSGNFRVLQLVVDGMKIQPCRPGFVDGRNAILTADKVKYNGADTCLIWSVFARRGLGYEAKQGNPANYADGVENFDPVPTCIKTLKIKKIADLPTINPGQEVQFTLTATNHKDAPATGVTVEDQLPAGLTFVSANSGGTFSNGVVRWNLGTLQTGQTATLRYTAKSNPALGSQRYFRDAMETDNRWASVGDEGIEIFELQNTVVKVGAFAWKGPSTGDRKNFWLETDQSFTVTGVKPVLRFWHQYDTKAGTEAGFLEVRKKTDQEWRRFTPQKVIRGAYTGKIPYSTLPIPFLNGFSGKSNDWVQSYFDLSDFKGQDITFRFRIGSDTSSSGAGSGWYIDEVEAMDLLNYDSEACISSAAGGDKVCARAPQSGVVVNPPAGGVDTDEPGTLPLPIQLQPNPTDGLLHVLLPKTGLHGPARLTLSSADGRQVYEQQIRSLSGLQLIPVDARAVATGLYFLRLETKTGVGVEKVMIY